MEKEVLKERLTKLVEIGLSKNKTLDFNDVNDFFAGECSACRNRRYGSR